MIRRNIHEGSLEEDSSLIGDHREKKQPGLWAGQEVSGKGQGLEAGQSWVRQEQKNEDWLEECRQRRPEAGLASAGCYCKARAKQGLMSYF